MLLLVLAVTVGMLLYQNPAELFRVSFLWDSAIEEVKLWKDKKGCYYIFLPGYAEMAELQFVLDSDTEISVNGIKIFDGASCENFECDVSYDMEYTVFGIKKKNQLVFVRSGGVATMFLETESGSMDYVHENIEYEESGSLAVYTEDGKLDQRGSLESISGRGNYTWVNSEKKPYSITLSHEADLLGMGEAQKWILLANAADPALIRNKIVYNFAENLGLAYTPDSRWVDLYLNGDYVGLYQLCERIEVHPQRVNIAQSKGYLVSQERADRIDGPYVETGKRLELRIRYPLQVTEEYLAKITEKWQTFENAVAAEDGIDPATGKRWENQIDLDSWVRKYLVEEIFANHDAGYTSQYFYSNGIADTDLIFAGPVWDYDLSMGNENCWQLREPKSFFANRRYPEVGVQTPWLPDLYQKEQFLNHVKEVYQLVALDLLNVLIEKEVTDYIHEIEKAAIMNNIRWMQENINIYTEAHNIQNYLRERISFLNGIWIEEQPYVCVRAAHQWGGYYAYYVVSPGNSLTMLPKFEDTKDQIFLGWFYMETDEPVDVYRPITEDIEIIAKWETKSSRKAEQILQLLPLGIIAILGFGLLMMEIQKSRKA